MQRSDAEAIQTARIFGGLGGIFALALTLALLPHAGCSGRVSEVTTLTVPSAGAAESTDPAIATDPDRADVLLAFVAGDSAGWRIHFSRSGDHGASWTVPVAVTPPGEPIHPHGESSPRLVAAEGGRLALIWSTSVHAPGREWPASDVRFSRSMDGGRTWSAPVTLNDDRGGGHSFHGATLSGSTGLVVAWLDERPVVTPGGGTVSPGDDAASLYFTHSADFGSSWAPNAGVATGVCPCCRVTLTANLVGEAFGAWRKTYPDGIRDAVWGELGRAERRLQSDGWRAGGCPHSGPAFRIAAGARHAAWFTGAEGRVGVYYRRWPGDNDSTAAAIPVVTGENLPTAHVALAVAADQRDVVACDVAAGGARAITLAVTDRAGGRIERTVQVENSPGASYPQLTLAGGQAVVAWSASEDGRRSVRLARWRFER